MKSEEKTSQIEPIEKANYQDNKKVTFGRKVSLTKESVKRYRVTLEYIEVTDEERRIKRGIIENIMKKPIKK